MKANETKPIPLQYAATTSEAGYRRLEAAMLQMGHLRKALIRHRNAERGSHRLAFTFKLQNAHHTNVAQVANTLTPATNADINAAENIRHQGLLILTERHGKCRTPSTHRSAIRGLNPRSRAHFPRQPRIYRQTTKNGLRDQKGGITPALFLLPTTCKRPTDKASSMETSDRYTRRFGYSTHSTTPLTTGAKVFRSWLGQETRLGVPPETITVNKRIKPVSRRTRAVRRNSLSHKSS